MPKTYEAILNGNRVDWTSEAPKEKSPLRVHITILEEENSVTSRGEKMAEVLAKLAERSVFSEIKDPVEWQRELRKDRTLPARED